MVRDALVPVYFDRELRESSISNSFSGTQNDHRLRQWAFTSTLLCPNALVQTHTQWFDHRKNGNGQSVERERAETPAALSHADQVEQTVGSKEDSVLQQRHSRLDCYPRSGTSE